MKKTVSLCLCAAMLLSLLAGCGGVSGPKNEIAAFSAPETGKMTVTLRAEYNVGNESIRSALARQFPDVHFVSVFHCAQETQYELRQSLAGGTAEDLVFSPNMKAVSDIAPDCLLDLSAESFSQNYVGSALENCQHSGRLYYLPGPSSLYGIVYDKTLFNEKGWQVPRSLDEFLALVKTADASGIRAIQPSCKYARQAQLFFTMFDYAECFGGVENTRWLLDYQAGKATMKGRLEPALARYRQLRDAGVIRAADFDMQPGNRSKMLYNEHSCAMIVENEQAALYARQAKSDHEYGMFPFWCGNGADDDYLLSLPAWYVGANASLAEKGNEKKLAKVREILAWISTPEGQAAISGGEMTQISNVKDTPYLKNDFNSAIQATVEKGNLVPEVELMASGNGNPAEKALRAGLQKYLSGTLDADALLQSCDSARDAALSSGVDRGQKLGTAETNFTCLETGLFIADALREKAGADIGLCLVGTTHCGMVGRIYKGDVCRADVDALSLSVGQTSGDKNDKKLWLVSMTGAQLRQLLQQACAFDPQDNVPNIPYYVASGLKIRFAPWQAEKLVSVQLADGGALSDTASYRVALWGWPFETPCPGTVEKVWDDDCGDLLAEAVKKAGPLKPFADGRFMLVYENAQ